MVMAKQAVTDTQSIESVEKSFKRERNGYTATFEGQMVGKEQISPSGKSNLEQVVKDLGGGGGGRDILAIQRQGKMFREGATGISIILSYTQVK